MSTVLICALIAITNVTLALHSISLSAARALAIAFAATAVTFLLAAVLPRTGAYAHWSLLLLHAIGALGIHALWCGLCLRAGHRINWWLLGTLFAIWLAPVLGILLLGIHPGAQIPLTAISIFFGAAYSIWCLYQKRGRKNAGDWAVIIWMTPILAVAAGGMMTGMSSPRIDPNATWIFYLNFLPIIFAGIGLFTLLSVALDALSDSRALARTDGLTGLLNRRAFDSELGVAVARSERYQRDLSLIMLDIDEFKSLNDNYGHPAGDAVLRIVARVLTGTARRIDVVTRIGGEEFAIILPDTPASAALRLAERLRQAIGSAGTHSIAFSASFGVASIKDTGHDPEALLRSADEALYAAKKAGRNCVRYALEPQTDPSMLIGLVQ